MTREKTVVSINKPTPRWATWAFRVVFCLTTAASVWVAATELIKKENKTEIMVAFKAFDFVIWGIGRGLGVKKVDFEEE